MRKVVRVVALCGVLVRACGPTGDGAAPSESVDLVEPAATVEVAAEPVLAADASGDVAVRVTWHDGTPAAGANVGLGPVAESRATQRWGVTDADGRFVWHEVPSGSFIVETDRGYMDRIDREAPGPVEAKLSFPDSADIAITVVDGEDRPVRGATVMTSGGLHDRAHVVAMTDVRGECVVRDLMGQVEARHPGYGPSSVEFTARDALRLVLADVAREASGRVVDPHGAPIADAVVTVWRRQYRMTDPDFVTAQQTTDETGRFALDALPAESVELEVKAEGFAPLDVEVDLRDADTAFGDLTLARGWHVHGVVTNEHGEPVAGARVWRGGLLRRDSTRTDADGAYRLVDLPVRWDNTETPLRVEHPGHVDTTHRDDPLFVSGPDVEWNPVLSVGGTIRGIVLDVDGEPVGSGWVDAEREGGDVHDSILRPLASDGTFVLAGVPDAAHSLTVRVGSRTPVAVLEGVRPGADLRIELTEPGRIVGHVEVVGSSDLRTVTLRRDGDPFPRQRARFEQDGRFEFVDVTPGEYILEFLGLDAPSPRDVVVQPGEVTDVGLITAPVEADTPGTISVRLVATDEELLAHAAVHLMKRGDSAWPIKRGAADGVVEFEGVVPGEYDVAVIATDGRIAEARYAVTVEPGAQLEVVHELVRGGRVDVRAEWSTSSRGADARAVIEVRDAGGSVVHREVDEVYRTVLEDLVLHLPPGRYAIEITDEAGRSGRATFDVFLGEPTTVSVEVR